VTTIVFMGDSITDCGRRDTDPPYGTGYVNLIRTMLRARTPSPSMTCVNRGVGGDTVLDLAARWQRDAIETRPDWLSVMIGINDVWRAFDGRPDDAVPLEVFESTLRGLLGDAVDATGTRLILADPYLIEPDRDEPQRACSDTYGAAVRRLAGEFDAVHVPTQAAFDRALANSTPDDWSHDRIHPNPDGHRLIADEFLRAVGAQWA
jgi:lysophospholipase L1-like esterase